MLCNIKHKLLNNRKGSLTVEAAIFLPLFIIGMMTLGYLVKFNAVQENVFHSFADETGSVAAHASISPPTFYKNNVLSRVADENGSQIKNTKISNFRYRTSILNNNELIAASIDYEIDVGLPSRFIKSIPASDTIICRAFVGQDQPVAPMPFSEMENSLQSETVWVFPMSGVRYHGENCSYIANEPKERLLSPLIKSSYSPCKLCKPSDLRYGNLVYCFSTGSVYHKGECVTIVKYVTAMEKEEAENRGYLACSRCGGK